MTTLLKDKSNIGVIIARMQVPYLTDSHKNTINTVLNRHERVIIFLGTTNQRIDIKNPYTFEFRKEMLLSTFWDANITVIPLPDNLDNKMWVNVLDTLITAFLNRDELPTLYGGRDSFIPYYKKDNGIFNCVELSPVDYDSGTELRRLKSKETPKYSPETATTILWTLNQIL